MEQTNPVQNIANEPVGFPGATQVPQAPQKKNWKWLIILILFLVVIGGVTFFVFKSSKSSTTDEGQTPEPTAGLSNVATPEPTPSATPADKSKLNVSVLNGTGIPGEAGILSDQLKKLGYTNVTTGNASVQNATDTQVTFGTGVAQDVITEITGSLQATYTNVTTSNSSLPSGTDIQITTGLRKGQTAAPAATTAPAATSTNSPTASPSASPTGQ